FPAQPGPEPVQAPGTGPRSYFTRRVAVFAAVLFVVAMTVAIPAQRYVAQRQNISDLRLQVASGTERVAELDKAVATANEPYAIEREARRRLHFVMPGELAYRVTDPLLVEQQQAAKAEADGAWWGRMLESVNEAARPVEELPTGQSAPQ
ncbi:septum formation initiator family protein, partial [Sporichthya sp.]|uniref:FtsB family cell division protein n=1 Tax=Sporichthya sp. TaxID=65475 RepID=UPI0017A23BEB